MHHETEGLSDWIYAGLRKQVSENFEKVTGVTPKIAWTLFIHLPVYEFAGRPLPSNLVNKGKG
jgi:hypothetical protein